VEEFATWVGLLASLLAFYDFAQRLGACFTKKIPAPFFPLKYWDE